MDDEERTDQATQIMMDFARITGLEPISPRPRRYLWTDAFAVCNFLELYGRTRERRYLDLSVHLVEQVHHTLGRHREDDARKGWISGLDEKDGENHPTAGGLRIGKRLNERAEGEPADPSLEWEMDGQYYHYLTKWMHALNRVGRVTSDPKYSTWAMELARRATSAFIYSPPGGSHRRMYWKMSIDLRRPLVGSMGQHDPLDGYVTYSELQATATTVFGHADLRAEIEEMGTILRFEGLPTDDALGMGGLLMDIARIAQIEETGFRMKAGLLEAVADAVLISLGAFAMGGDMAMNAESRLAFRELGLSIGLKGLPMARSSLANSRDERLREGAIHMLEGLDHFIPIGKGIDDFWTTPANQRAATWSEHREINMVMLATSLAPGSFLSI
jgi:hypothetical protein